MSELKEFLLTRIAEDEAECRPIVAMDDDYSGGWSIIHATRILAECEAKRAIIKTCIPIADEQDEYILRTLAAVYADHPDYQDEWKVKG